MKDKGFQCACAVPYGKGKAVGLCFTVGIVVLEATLGDVILGEAVSSS